jgi:hypothetical protein
MDAVGEAAHIGFGQREWFPSMPESHAGAGDGPADLITFLRSIPDGRMSRGAPLSPVLSPAGGNPENPQRLP